MSDAQALRACLVFGYEIFFAEIDGGQWKEKDGEDPDDMIFLEAKEHGLIVKNADGEWCDSGVNARASAALERFEKMEKALRRAADQFEFYAQNHFAKKTEDSHAKGMTNTHFAAEMREALGIDP